MRWLRDKGHGESPSITDIPPSALDIYLTEFFISVERKDGNEYHSSGLRRLRESLQYYLKTCGYPMSITKSPTFLQSQRAFQEKFHLLKEKEALQNGTKQNV